MILLGISSSVNWQPDAYFLYLFIFDNFFKFRTWGLSLCLRYVFFHFLQGLSGHLPRCSSEGLASSPQATSWELRKNLRTLQDRTLLGMFDPDGKGPPR